MALIPTTARPRPQYSDADPTTLGALPGTTNQPSEGSTTQQAPAFKFPNTPTSTPSPSVSGAPTSPLISFARAFPYSANGGGAYLRAPDDSYPGYSGDGGGGRGGGGLPGTGTGGGTGTGTDTGTGTTTPTKPASEEVPYSFGAFRDAFNKVTAGKQGTLTEFISDVFPTLQKMFPGIKRIGSKGDKIQLPDGTIIDAVISAGMGGRGYAFQVVNGPGSFFGDPIGDWFSTLVGSMIDKLNGPHSLDPHVQDSYNILRGLINGGGGGDFMPTPFSEPDRFTPTEFQAPDPFKGSEFNAPDLSGYQDATQRRIAELSGEPFSATEEAAQRVKAFDNLERSRQVAIQQTRERLAAMGHAPTSGTVEAAIQQVNASFDALRAQNENALLLNNIGERQRRHAEAQGLQGDLADRIMQIAGQRNTFNQGEDQIRSQYDLNTADMRERARQANQAALEDYILRVSGMRNAHNESNDALRQRAQEAAAGRSLSAAQALAALSQWIGNFMDPTSRIGQILAAAGMIPGLESERFNQAQKSLG